MNNFEYTKPASVAAGLAEISVNKGAFWVAGGTNLIDRWKYNLVHPEKLVDVAGLREGEAVTALPGGGVRLNAFATNAETAYHPLLESRYPLLSRAILAGASGQIRNMATNGGNLLQRTRCYYFYDAEVPCNKRIPGSGCPALQGHNRIHAILGQSDSCIAVFPSDMCVALAALEAVVQVSGISGNRSIPFRDFHRLPGNTPQLDNNLQPGELITAIDLPEKGFAQNYSYLKLRDRHSYAFALVSVATGLELENGLIREARMALGGVAHKPWRVEQAEAFLAGKPASAETFAAAAGMVLEGAQGYKHNEFKIELTRRAIVRNGLMALQPEATQKPGAGPV